MKVWNSLRCVTEFLALRRNTSLLPAALVLAGTGEKLWPGFAPKYIEVLAHGVLSAAQIVLIIGLFDALRTFLGARLWRVGPRASFIGAALCGAPGTIWFWWFVCLKENNSTQRNTNHLRAET